MSDSRWFQVYSKLPVGLQNVACTLAGIQMRRSRYNRSFYRALRFLEDSQRWPLDRQRMHQDEQLRRVIKHAYESVPYYRETMDERKLCPDDIRTVDDLPKLPILNKSVVRARVTDLLSRSWPARRRVTCHTGGTTGAALELVADVDTQPWQWAVWWRHRRRFGLKLADPFIVFAGRKVVPLSSMRPPIWRRNVAMHQTYVSVHHMTMQNMPPLVDYLQKRRVAFYSGYPSALYLLATYMLENGIRLRHPPRMTVTGAETVLPHQRQVIERALETEVTDQYGASEQCGNISECSRHAYHIDMEFGVVELLAKDGMPVDVRRIVCTGFHNPAMPLIRYDIGDLAVVSDRTCPCGLQAPTVERIDGRIESYIITPDGRQLGRLDFLFKETANIEEAQLVQECPDRLTVRIVRGDKYNDEDEASLLRELRKYLGGDLQIQPEYIPEIPREANGKFRQIVSHVHRDRFAD